MGFENGYLLPTFLLVQISGVLLSYGHRKRMEWAKRSYL